MSEATLINTENTRLGVREVPELFLIPPLGVESSAPAPGLIDVQQCLESGNLDDYRQLVDYLRLTDKDQLAIVEKIKKSHLALAESVDSIYEIWEDSDEIDKLCEQLLIGNLANILDTAYGVIQDESPRDLVKIIDEGNRLADEWLKCEYGTLEKSSKAPACPTEDLCLSYLMPRLNLYKTLADKKFKTIDFKTASTPLNGNGHSANYKSHTNGQTRETKAETATETEHPKPSLNSFISLDRKKYATPRKRIAEYYNFRDDPVKTARNIDNNLVDYLVDKTVQTYSGSIHTARKVLAALAGSKALKDPETAERYKELQAEVSKIIISNTGNVVIRVAGYFLPEFLADKPQWHNDSACLDFPEVDFYPRRGQSTKEAKSICKDCLVKDECLFVNLGDRYGIWGGLSERQRRRFRRAIKQKMEPEPLKNLLRELRGIEDSEEEDDIEDDEELQESAIA